MPALTPQSPLPVRTAASSVPNRDWFDHRSRETTLSVETVALDFQGATVQVGGELDLGTAPPLWAVLRSHLLAGRRFLRLDVTSLTFVDASALAGLRAIHDEALAARGTLVVTGVRALVARVLHLTGFDEVLFLGGSRAEHELPPLQVS
ncbi:STAS domain-containing protein [uncultured Jatrophihabitans sp.]|uniref:STAS domain-containing protein n=1 Tax=uncultured Jatrophihabitans sp. TaxID=1610747 RepID=UPI0035CB69F0